MIKKFKEKALVVEVDIMEDCYPGNPKYIGMQSDKKVNEFLIKSCKENNLEIPDIGGPFHYYPLCISESEIESYYNDALYSTLNMSVSGLERALLDLKTYSYDSLYKALDVLSLRFANDEIDSDKARIDVKSFKNIYRKTFKKQLSICGRVTPYFVGSMRRELQLRNKYLDMLRDKFKEMIAIEKKTIPESVSNEVSSFGNSFKPDNNVMKIDFNLIFYNAAQYVDEPDEMKEYIKREYKKAEKEFYYGIESFCKGILKVVVVERDSAKARIHDQPIDTDTHIIIGCGLRYTFEEIDLIEQIVKELLHKEKKNNEMNTKGKSNNRGKQSKAGEQLSDIDVQESQYLTEEVYYAKHYVLAFMFDYSISGGRYEDLLGQKKKIINIAESRLNGEFSSDRFYKVFNELVDLNIDLENENSIINIIGDDWKDIVINLSNEPKKMKEHLKME